MTACSHGDTVKLPLPLIAEGTAIGVPERLTMVTGCAVLDAKLILLPFITVELPLKVAMPKLSNGICLCAEKLGSSSIHSAEDKVEL